MALAERIHALYTGRNAEQVAAILGISTTDLYARLLDPTLADPPSDERLDVGALPVGKKIGWVDGAATVVYDDNFGALLIEGNTEDGIRLDVVDSQDDGGAAILGAYAGHPYLTLTDAQAAPEWPFGIVFNIDGHWTHFLADGRDGTLSWGPGGSTFPDPGLDTFLGRASESTLKLHGADDNALFLGPNYGVLGLSAAL